jgi:hypothetical protein
MNFLIPFAMGHGTTLTLAPGCAFSGNGTPCACQHRMIEKRKTDALHRLSWALDEMFRVPGTKMRFGLDALIGLLPAGGDLAGGIASAWILIAAQRMGAGPIILARMGLNIFIDTVVGAVPVIGDLFDAGWKSNQKNIALLDRYLEAPEPARRSSIFILIAVLAVIILLFIASAVLSYHIIRWILAQL